MSIPLDCSPVPCPAADLAISLAACGLLVGVLAVAQAAEQKFFSDDPLAREPETQDASGAQPWDIDLFYDLSYNLFVTPGRAARQRARAERQHDRRGARLELVHQPHRRPRAHGRGARARPGRRPGAGGDEMDHHAREERGSGGRLHRPGRERPDVLRLVRRAVEPRGATGAVVVATKIFWALGYNQVEYFLTEMRRDAIDDRPQRDDAPPVRQPHAAHRTVMSARILERAHRRPDGSYRTAAGRLLPGKVLGGFKYDGTRPTIPTTSFRTSTGAS